MNALEGSGTFVGIAGIATGLTALGHEVLVRPLGRRTRFHTLDRWLYNLGVLLRPPVGVDVVMGVDLDGFLWARRRRIPFVASLKGIIADELKNERGWVRVLLQTQAHWERLNTGRADLVMVTSRYCAEVARREYGVPAERIAIVPESIDLEAWDDRFARAHRRRRDGPVVLSVARMYPRKRLGDLLRAARVLRDRIPGAEVRIVGRGPEWDSLVRLHGDLGLGESTQLLGDVSREQLAEEYVNADVFCLPSVQEGFGIVFLEAMAAGLPVVACRAAAIPEVVGDGATGLLTPPRDPAALAQALENLLRDPVRAGQLGAEGRRRVEGFTPRHVAERFLRAVTSLRGIPRGQSSVEAD
ncbi:MAG TPA: glycosyltransferase family 4 protein [Candidatus Methylomirabilis sp.]|nr:glycosyltransferase family 4 protein [Candidatus Methylomirabilis sp.]